MSTAAQRTRHREQREQTRAEILSAAQALLRERPFRELSVELVMTQTGLTRTAFYRHFDDVTELVLRVLEDIGGELYVLAERWRARAGHDYPDAALVALDGIVEFFAAHGPLVRAVKEAASTDERVEKAYTRYLDAFVGLTRQGLDDLIARGQIEPVDSSGLALALNLMNEAYLLEELGREPFGDPNVVRATLATIWLRAVGPVEPARK